MKGVIRSLWPMVYLALAGVLWLMPVLCHGSKMSRMTWLSGGLRYQANCTALFTNRQGAWSQACYLVKPQGDAEWSGSAA